MAPVRVDPDERLEWIPFYGDNKQLTRVDFLFGTFTCAYRGIRNNDINANPAKIVTRAMYSEACMKVNFQKASQIVLMVGLLLIAISYFIFGFENLLLNLLMYAVLTVGFALNLIAVLKGFR